MMFEIYLTYFRGHGYGYCRTRASYLSSKGKKNALTFQYELGMVEGFKEYENPILQQAFEKGQRVGRHFGEMTNLAEDGKCLQSRWLEQQKYYYQMIEEYKKWCKKNTLASGLE